MSLRNKTAVITGASRGIGREIARSFAAEGSRLVLVARSHEQLVSVAQEIGEEKCIIAPADLKDPVEIDGLAATISERAGAVDILVNAAGV